MSQSLPFSYITDEAISRIWSYGDRDCSGEIDVEELRCEINECMAFCDGSFRRLLVTNDAVGILSYLDQEELRQYLSSAQHLAMQC